MEKALDLGQDLFTEEPTELTPLDKIEPEFKLQLYYRMAFEFRLANMITFGNVSTESLGLNFLLLVMATTSSVMLMLASSKADFPYATVAAVLAALVTVLTGLTSFKAYSLRIEQHGVSLRRFATVEREFLLLLQCCSNKQQIKRFDEAAVGLAEAQKTMPVLPMHSLSKLKDEEGGTLFDAITLVAKRTQADETHVAMVKLAKLPDDH